MKAGVRVQEIARVFDMAGQSVDVRAKKLANLPAHGPEAGSALKVFSCYAAGRECLPNRLESSGFVAIFWALEASAMSLAVTSTFSLSAEVPGESPCGSSERVRYRLRDNSVPLRNMRTLRGSAATEIVAACISYPCSLLS